MLLVVIVVIVVIVMVMVVVVIGGALVFVIVIFGVEGDVLVLFPPEDVVLISRVVMNPRINNQRNLWLSSPERGSSASQPDEKFTSM